jgi:uroporphyrinogen III methyltransferase/synthase
LITVKGREVLATAGVVIYDNLAAPELLDDAPPNAVRIYAGKKRSDHSMTQDEICRILIENARAGSTVVRLKGGDPYIFGRGGEEVEALIAAGIPFEVVPGVTSALGIAAYAGVPLTHRDHTSSVTFVTGHDPDHIDWTHISHSETLVVYMGVTAFARIAEHLISAGRDADTPAIVVERATSPRQRSVRGTIATLASRIREDGVKPPATIVIGDVASLQLDWFERRPLFGKPVVITRAETQSGESAQRLRDLGAWVHEIPMIEILPPADAVPLRAALADIGAYQWIILTSANAVSGFFDALFASGSDARAIRGKVCAIGAKTAAAMKPYSVRPDFVANQSTAEGIVELLSGEEMHGARVLLPRAAAARDVVPEALRRRGAVVDIVEVYRTGVPTAAADRLARLTRADWITFTSPSTVKHFLALGGRRLLDAGARAASIGPVTSEALRAHGIEPAVEAREQSMDAVVDAILNAI